MKILVFTTAYLPFIGGAELAIKEITERLPEHQFFVITTRLSRRLPRYERIGNAEVHRVGTGFWSYGDKLLSPFLGAILAWRLVRKHKIELFWCVMVTFTSGAPFILKILGLVRRVPILLTLQEGDPEEHLKFSNLGLTGLSWFFAVRLSNHIQAISTYLAEYARRVGARCPIEVVPNGVDLERFKIKDLRFKNKEVFTIISISRLVHKNGIDTLIRAVAQLKTYNLKLKTLIVGSGPDEKKLKSLAKELGVADAVEFVGEVPPDEVPRYLAQADIFVRPSRSEGLGTAFLEAMAAGLPVIGTPVGGIPDFLKDGETGFFVKVDDPADLAQKIKLLITDNQLRNQIAQNGRKLVMKNYSWDKIAQRMNSIFKKLITYNLQLKTILVATGLYPPEIGGPATHTVMMERELPKRGFAVNVLPFRTVRRLPSVIRHLAYFAKCVSRADCYNLIFAQDTVSVGFPAALASVFTDRPFVVRVPGDWAWEQAVQRWGVKDGIDDFQRRRYGFRLELLRAVQRFVVNRADLVIAPSEYFNRIVSGWVRNPNRVRTIYNGIELPTTNYQLPTTNFSKTIISVGRLVPWKGFGTLIELMKDLPDWKLVIVGDGPERERLKIKVERLKISERVKFTGAVSREKLFEYLRAADVFVLNSSFESFSFQTVEAMSVGLPVIVTNIGSLPEIVEDGVSGILVEPNNRLQLREAVIRIGADKTLRRRLAASARKTAQRFSIERTATELVEFLNNLLAKR